MLISLKTVFSRIKSNVGLPSSVEFRVSDDFGFPINRARKVRPLGLTNYINGVDGSVRVATFLREIERRIGARVAARIELWHAGHRIDGRRSLGSLI